MNTTQTTLAKITPAPAVSVELAESIFQTPTPTIRVSYPKGTHFRKAHAGVLCLAAAVELATPVTEGWVVVVHQDGDLCGRVVVETSEGSEAEARRAMSVLRAVVAAHRPVSP